MVFRQLGRVPAATEGEDELHTGGKTAGLEVGGGALVGKEGGLRDQNFEVAGGAALVALVGEVKRVLGRIDGAVLDRGLLFQDAKVGELVFDFVEGSEHGGFVGGRLRFVVMAGLISKGVALAGVEEQFRCLRTQTPQRARALKPGATVGAFKTALPS